MNAKCRLLVDILDQAFDRPAWHGTNLRGSLRRPKLADLLWRPTKERHNIWEVALHTAYWKYIIWRKLTGAPKGSFPRSPSDWPNIPVAATNNEWKRDLTLLDEQHSRLRQAVLQFTDSKLARKVPGSKYRYDQLIYGVASHDLYHAGQIQLLKRLMPFK